MTINARRNQIDCFLELFPIQRQILGDMCKGGQVVCGNDSVYRSCVEIAGKPRLSVYGLNEAAMARLCALVWQIDTSIATFPSKDDEEAVGYEFHYVPAVRRMEVSEMLTLTTRAPRDLIVVSRINPQLESGEGVDIDRSRA